MVFLDSLVFVVVIINTILSLSILLRNRKARENQYYFIFVTFLDLWILSNFLENEPGLIGLANLEWSLRLDFVFAIFIFYGWFYFCRAFIQRKFEKYKYRWFDAVILLSSILLGALSLFSQLIITNVSFYDNVIHFDPGGLWFFYAILLLFLSIGGLVILFLGRRRAKADGKVKKRQQIDLVFLGFFLSIGNAIFVNLFLQTFLPISLEVSRFGLYGMTIMVVLIAYAIVRRQLFELRLLIVRAITFVLLVIVIAAVYVTALVLGAVFLFKVTLDIEIILFSIILTTLIALSFGYLQDLVAKITNRIFFKGRYDSDKLLAELTHIMAETIDLDKMTEKILKTLSNEIGLSKAAFLIIDKNKISDIKGVGYIDHSLTSSKFNQLIKKYPNSDKGILFVDLEEGPVKDFFRKFDISIAIPMQIKSQRNAILILGPKLSGEIYYQRDMDLLDIFASGAAIAIQNAKAFAEIKEFSRKLEKRVEERTKELRETQESELAKARELARLKDEFVFVAAHELRTPVTAIKGFLELVSESINDFPRDIQEHLMAVASASGNLSQLVNDLLEIARSEAGTMRIAVEPMDVAAIVRKAAKELSVIAGKRKVSLKMTTYGVVPKAFADPIKVKEVIVNLLSNAIKYNKKSGRVDASVFAQGGNLIVEIRDAGHGIPREQQDKIFQKFFRAELEETRSVIGTGLGLFIARMLVEKMGGKIMFTSVEGEGSTFAFSLPLEES